MCMHTYIHTYMHAYIHTYIHTYLHIGLDLRNEEVRNFCEIATHFGKVIRNCES